MAVQDRSRTSSDPIRNFKFGVTFFLNQGVAGTIEGTNNQDISTKLTSMGFSTVEGLNMSTEMIPYREGGWNTNPHKIPGMTDFSPVTMSSGVIPLKSGMWDLARQMFSVQWGEGTLPEGADYRMNVDIDVFDHPVTVGSPSNAKLRFKLYNAWVANISFSGLNAMENAILVQQLTLHHEGMDVVFS
jgi:phage tail-like protein